MQGHTSTKEGRFTLSMLQYNHDQNYNAFCQSLSRSIDTIIVDNTNIAAWHFERYVEAAKKAGYEVKEEVVGRFNSKAASEYAHRCLHGVPYDKVLEMLEQWREEQGGDSSDEGVSDASDGIDDGEMSSDENGSDSEM